MTPPPFLRALPLLASLAVACGGAKSNEPANDGGGNAGASSSGESGGSLGASGAGEAASEGGAAAAGTPTAGASSGGASSGGSSSGGVSPGGASSGGVATGGADAGLPLGCVSLCEGGDCDCWCDEGGGCDDPDWTEVTFGWNAFSLSEQPGAGVTLCYPPGWLVADPQPAINTPQLSGYPNLTLQAYAALDHAGAVDFVSGQDRAWCTYAEARDYGVRFLDVNGWPAMEQSYVTPAPVCGECAPSTEPALLASAFAYLATGNHVIALRTGITSDEASSLAVLFQVARTVRVDDGEVPSDTAGDLNRLRTEHVADCAF
jgi:hypothetical protein